MSKGANDASVTFNPSAPKIISGSLSAMNQTDVRLYEDKTFGSVFALPPKEVMYRSWIGEFISCFIFGFLVYLASVYSLAIFFPFPSSIFGAVVIASIVGLSRGVCIALFGPEKAGFLNPNQVITEMFTMSFNWILGGVMVFFIQPIAYTLAAGLAFALIPDPLAAISGLGTPTPNAVILSFTSDAQVFFLVTLFSFIEISITTWSMYANNLPKIRLSAELMSENESGTLDTPNQYTKTRRFGAINMTEPVAPNERAVIQNEYGAQMYSEKRKGFFMTGVLSGVVTFIVSLGLTPITGGTTNLFLWLWIAVISGTVSSASGIVAGSLAANVLVAPVLAFLVRKIWEYAASGRLTYDSNADNVKRE
jgi:hypothetical protein